MQYTLHLTEGTWYRAGTKMPPIAKPIENKRICTMKGAANEVVINTNEGIIIGRDETCDVVLDSSHVSRKHVLLYAHRGKLLIKDTSTYGTTIIREDAKNAAGYGSMGKEQNQIVLKQNVEPYELQSEDTLIFGHVDQQLIIYIMER